MIVSYSLDKDVMMTLYKSYVRSHSVLWYTVLYGDISRQLRISRRYRCGGNVHNKDFWLEIWNIGNSLTYVDINAVLLRVLHYHLDI